jgi:hypothetical protein
MREFHVAITQTGDGDVAVGIYEVTQDLQVSFVDACSFGPNDTCEDITRWVLRKLSPRLKLPLR